ncbi:MAG: GAF domain-containing protein [Deltaproteobacteria bacterium]|nr:GAF domain-containing protein [Deltaproteobacteria bacterium]MBW1960871.1 GAF domain-containing protein [Deltaproteobacteria bacterium]MBW2150739.1 GAF domain-containing protein [Deltaproteobacteria bacterium]
MNRQDKIDVEIFKTVSKAIAESDNLEIMTHRLSQLLVAALEIKGCTIFVFNPTTKELERLASFGLSAAYLSKGPVLSDKSMSEALNGTPVIIRDVNKDDRLQYPAEAKQEGIAAILSIPIRFSGTTLGVLRLYHHTVWDISERDCESLLILADHIGLCLQYTRLLNAVQTIRDAIEDLPRGPSETA